MRPVQYILLVAAFILLIIANIVAEFWPVGSAGVCVGWLVGWDLFPFCQWVARKFTA